MHKSLVFMHSQLFYTLTTLYLLKLQLRSSFPAPFPKKTKTPFRFFLNGVFYIYFFIKRYFYLASVNSQIKVEMIKRATPVITNSKKIPLAISKKYPKLKNNPSTPKIVGIKANNP